MPRSQGILRLRASVHRSTAPALAVVRGLGAVLATRSEGSVVELVVRLAD